MSNLVNMSEHRERPMIKFENPGEIGKSADVKYWDELKAKSSSQKDVLTGLASHVENFCGEARRAKTEHEEELLMCLRQRRGTYEPELAAQIGKDGGSKVYLMITDVKVRGAKAAITDILLSQDDIWGLRPTPIPDMSKEMEDSIAATAMQLFQSGQYTKEEVLQIVEEGEAEIKKQQERMAATRAEKMQTKIEDQLEESDFESELEMFIDDICTFGTGILKGPIFKVKQTLKWTPDYKAIVSEEIVLDVDRVSPFDFFPGAHNSTVDDGPCFIQHRLLAEQLHAMLGQKGSDDESIREILELYGESGHQEYGVNNYAQRAELEGKKTAFAGTSSYIAGKEYRGGAQGRALIAWGMDPERIGDPLKTYQVECWIIAGKVIRCVLNGDPLGVKPISKSVFAEVPGSFWGQGIPYLMRDVQAICNAAVRALVDNMAIASGPQVAIDANAMPSGENITSIYPWKIWQITQSHGGTGNLPIKFFQPEMRSAELLNIYERFAKYADEVTGIPAYQYGSSNVGGAGSTASGLSMLLNSSSKNLKQVIKSIDRAIAGLIYRCFVYNMLYDQDQSIKGDVNIDVLGSNALIHKEQQQVRRMEMLNFTNNEIDLQIMGIEGRADLLKETFKSFDLDPDIIPTGDELRAKMMEKMQQEEAMIRQEQAGAESPGKPQTINAAGAPSQGMNQARARS